MDWEADNEDVRHSTSSTLVHPLTPQSHSTSPGAEMLAAMKAYANDIAIGARAEDVIEISPPGRRVPVCLVWIALEYPRPTKMKAFKRLAEAILSNKVHFLVKLRIKGAHVSDQPHLDQEGSDYFRQRISKSQVYLEYGSGGSTIVASQSTKQMFTVESDAAFLRAVRNRLKSIAEPHSQVTLIFVNIGLTEEWGIPIFKRPTKRRVARWGRYATAPWEKLRTRGIEPDTILVDGRFRVACVLQSILNLSSRSNCFILIDDYFDRPEYRAVEEFTDIHGVYGRMAVVMKKEKFDAEGCRQRLVEYQADWR